MGLNTHSSYTLTVSELCVCLGAQSCPTLCDPMDCSPPDSSVHGDSSVKNTGVGCCVLLQEISSTQGSNPSLSHCRQILYQLSHLGSLDSLISDVKLIINIKNSGTSLAVQWVKLYASNAGGEGSIIGQGTEIPRVMGCGQ